MKKLLIASLVATLALTACKKEEAPAEPKADTQTAPETANQTTTTPPADTHDHTHGDHSHNEAEHTHHHHEGEKYQCNNNKTISVSIHDHEGEIEAHATIDDIEYDLHPAEGKANEFVSLHEGLNDKGMKMLKDGDKLTFTDLDSKPLLDCQLAKTL